MQLTLKKSNFSESHFATFAGVVSSSQSNIKINLQFLKPYFFFTLRGHFETSEWKSNLKKFDG